MPSVRITQVVCFVLCILLGMSEPARAEHAVDLDPPATLDWSAPVASPCITRERLVQRVEQLVGHAVFAPSVRPALRIRGAIVYREGLYVASVTARSSEGELLGARTLTQAGPECQQLDGSLSLIIALLIDQSAPALAQAPKRHEVPARWAIAAAGALQTGLLPSVALGALAEAQARVGPHLRLALTGLVFGHQTQRDAQGQGARFAAWALGLAARPRLYAWQHGAELEASLATELGAVHAAAIQLTPAAPPRARLLAQTKLELALSWPLWRRVALRFGGGAVVALSRPRFHDTRVTEPGMRVDELLQRPARLGASAQLGIIIGVR